MKKIILILTLMMWTFSAQALQILATVNDEVITSADVSERQALLEALFQAKMPTDKVLDSLINEKVKQLTAAKENITLTEAQIADGVAFLERQNGMEAGFLEKFIKEKKLSQASLSAQISADLLWLNYIGQKKEKQPEVSDKEITKEREKIKKQMTEGGYLLAEIFIPFDGNEAAAEQEAQTLFNRIVDGESFTDLAKQYSKGKTAAQMGDLGWVKSGQMEKAIDKVLPEMKAGQLSKPIKGKKGYTLVLVREVQPALDSDMQEVWQVVQFVTTKEDYPMQKEAIEKAGASCMAFTKFAEDNGLEGSHSGAMPEMLVARLPEELKSLLTDKAVGELTGPVDMQQYLVFVMKCGSRVASILPDKETIKQQILMRKMENVSDDMLQDARKKMLVDIK